MKRCGIPSMMFSEWFEFEQGFYQGCVITPLMLNMFFAAVLHIALARFNSDGDILRDIVEFRKRGNESVVKSTPRLGKKRKRIGPYEGSCTQMTPVLSRRRR